MTVYIIYQQFLASFNPDLQQNITFFTEIIAYTVYRRVFKNPQNISEKKCFISMTTGDCKFLTNILAFISNISFSKISLVELTNFPQALKTA